MALIESHESYPRQNDDAELCLETAPMGGDAPNQFANNVLAYQGEEIKEGPVLRGNGVDFAIRVGENAKAVFINEVSRDNGETIRRWQLPEPTLDPDKSHPTKVYAGHIEGMSEGSLYEYNVYGRNVFDQHEPNKTVPPLDIYDGSKGLLDTRARAVHRLEAFSNPWEHGRERFFGVVIDESFDWGDDKRPNIQNRIVCETHVKGATKLLETIPPEKRGTYAGMATDEYMSHIKQMGFTSIELLPIHQFVNEPRKDDLTNYWGYNTLNFFAPHQSYSSDQTPGGQVKEFKQLVKKAHEHGVEVILDVVYNHTAEGGIGGPMYSFKGVDNDGFYMKDRFGNSIDNNGCGTNFDASREQGLSIILDSLRYWVKEMHVDGFRFDLAPVLARNSDGSLPNNIKEQPFMKAIANDPILSKIILIAEPWDMGGYINDSIGNFSTNITEDKKIERNGTWQEWNGKYRDAVRDVGRGQGNVRWLIDSLMSEEINFVTAHDGFTLHDLTAYNEKHNEGNGENNRDGETYNNRSYNHGEEGFTANPFIVEARRKAGRNMLSILLTSGGTPMLLAGDEVLRTQEGNNNAYCQDNELSYFPWQNKQDPHIREFMDYESTLSHLRARNPQLSKVESMKEWMVSNSPINEPAVRTYDLWGMPTTKEKLEAEGRKEFGVYHSGQFHDAESLITYYNIGRGDINVSLPHELAAAGDYVIVADSADGYHENGANVRKIDNNIFVLKSLSTAVVRRISSKLPDGYFGRKAGNKSTVSFPDARNLVRL